MVLPPALALAPCMRVSPHTAPMSKFLQLAIGGMGFGNPCGALRTGENWMAMRLATYPLHPQNKVQWVGHQLQGATASIQLPTTSHAVVVARGIKDPHRSRARHGGHLWLQGGRDLETQRPNRPAAATTGAIADLGRTRWRTAREMDRPPPFFSLCPAREKTTPGHILPPCACATHHPRPAPRLKRAPPAGESERVAFPPSFDYM